MLTRSLHAEGHFKKKKKKKVNTTHTNTHIHTQSDTQIHTFPYHNHWMKVMSLTCYTHMQRWYPQGEQHCFCSPFSLSCSTDNPSVPMAQHQKKNLHLPQSNRIPSCAIFIDIYLNFFLSLLRDSSLCPFSKNYDNICLLVSTYPHHCRKSPLLCLTNKWRSTFFTSSFTPSHIQWWPSPLGQGKPSPVQSWRGGDGSGDPGHALKTGTFWHLSDMTTPWDHHAQTDVAQPKALDPIQTPGSDLIPKSATAIFEGIPQASELGDWWGGVGWGWS